MLGVWGPSLISPGWLVLSITVRTFYVQVLKIRQMLCCRPSSKAEAEHRLCNSND